MSQMQKYLLTGIIFGLLGAVGLPHRPRAGSYPLPLRGQTADDHGS